MLEGGALAGRSEKTINSLQDEGQSASKYLWA